MWAVWVVCIVEFVGLWVVDFWWPVNTLLEMGVLEAEDGAVMGVVRLLPSSLAFIILNEEVGYNTQS